MSRILAKLTAEPTLRLIQFLVGVVAVVLIFWQLQFSTDAICCGDFDGYYHIKWTRALWDSIKARSFPPEFTWLPLTTLSPKEYVDDHLLFPRLRQPLRDVACGDVRAAAGRESDEHAYRPHRETARLARSRVRFAYSRRHRAQSERCDNTDARSAPDKCIHTPFRLETGEYTPARQAREACSTGMSASAARQCSVLEAGRGVSKAMSAVGSTGFTR